MFRLISLLMLALVAAAPPIHAQEKPPAGEGVQVDTLEILRWGDRCVESGTGHRSAESMLFTMAMSPPEVDKDKFHISVWGKSTDPHYTDLLKAFESSPWLAGFVAEPPAVVDNKPTNKKAWAWFHQYRTDDPTQDWRQKQFEVPEDSAPVVILQPPRSGKWGDGSIIMDRIESDEAKNPEQLHKRIQATVTLWVRKLAESGTAPLINFAEGIKAEPYAEARNAPWGEIPKLKPFNPQWVQFPPGGPAAPTTPAPAKLDFAMLKALLPDAPDAWLYQQLMSGETDLSKIQTAWMLYKLANPTPPPGGALSSLTVFWAQYGNLIIIVGSIAFILWQRKAAATPELTDDQRVKLAEDLFNRITGLLSGSGIVPKPAAKTKA